MYSGFKCSNTPRYHVQNIIKTNIDRIVLLKTLLEVKFTIFYLLVDLISLILKFVCVYHTISPSSREQCHPVSVTMAYILNNDYQFRFNFKSV